MTDYSLWEVILNGDSPAPTRVIEGFVQRVAPTIAEQRLARKNELKARGTLLMALPDEHQLKFNIHMDAKTLMEAIEKRFRGNKETKKAAEAYHLKIYEAGVKISSFISTSTQNIAFVSSFNIDSTNEPVSAAASVYAVSVKIPVSALPNIDADDLDEMDLKWQMAMLTMRARRFIQRTGRNLGANGPTSMGFDTSKVECYNCHKEGHFARECSYGWSFQAEEEPTNYALMAFTSLSSDNKFIIISYKTGLESVEARLLVYQQNESVFEEDIKLLKLEVQLRDNALVVLRQNLKKAEQERDYLKLKLAKFQTSSKNLSQLLASQTNDKTRLGYNSQVFTHFMFDYDEFFTSESDESFPPSLIYDSYQSGNGYHDVPLPYTGTFMPPKPDLIYLTPIGPQHLSLRIGSDSKDDSETKIPQDAPSFVQPNEQVKTLRPSFKPIETSILTSKTVTAIPKPKSNGTRRNRKACFVCKSLDHLIKDLVLTQSKLVHITAARPVTAVVNAAKSVHGKWEWKPKCPILDHGNPQHALKHKGVIDSRCSRHMTWNMSYLSDFEELNGGYVAFGGNLKGGKIFGKGSGPTWLFDIDTLTKTMNYQPVTTGNQSNPSACVHDNFDAEKAGDESVQQYVLFHVWSSGSINPQNTDDDAAFEVKEPEFEERKPQSEVHVSPSNST
nr:hypothetical protein [Tanacetum cinerariifolium]